MKVFLLILCLSLLLGSCSNREPVPWNGPKLTQPRKQLSTEQLFQDSTFAWLDMSFFAKPAWAQKAATDFSGALLLKDSQLDFPTDRAPYAGELIFPGITLDFITHEGALLPLRKELIKTSKQSESYWDVQVGTGAVWQEETDGEWSRASFPLTLTDRYMGQARNCVASFVYKANAISNICLQCSQETANLEYRQLGDIRANLSAEYEPKHYPDATKLIEEHLEFQSRRVPVYPLSAIDKTHEIAEYFEQANYTNASVSLGAVLLEDTLYLHPPKTRHGPYPYPEEMRHCVFSATKSMAGALSLLYFAERYGVEIFNEPITAHVPALAALPEWQGVTFSHALNMVTGTVGSERNEHFKDVLVMPRTAEASINKIATLGDAPGEAGEIFNYGPTNTFVLSYALQKYVEKKEGKKISYWDLVLEQVLVPIGAPYFTVRHTIEPDGSKGIPLLSYGAIPTLDEAAKIALLFLNEGSHEGKQLLHKEKTREALGRTAWTGYSTDDDFRGSRYQHSFWSKKVWADDCMVQVNYMMGYGENYVLFLPSDAVIFRFMDEHDLDFSGLVGSVEKLRSSCKKK